MGYIDVATATATNSRMGSNCCETLLGHLAKQECVEKAKVQMSDRVIFGLLAVAVMSPINVDQKVPNGYHLTFAQTTLPINEWWGRAADFAAVVASDALPQVTLDLRSGWTFNVLRGSVELIPHVISNTNGQIA